MTLPAQVSSEFVPSGASTASISGVSSIFILTSLLRRYPINTCTNSFDCTWLHGRGVLPYHLSRFTVAPGFKLTFNDQYFLVNTGIQSLMLKSKGIFPHRGAPLGSNTGMFTSAGVPSVLSM